METRSHLTRGQTVEVAQMKMEAKIHLTRATLMVKVIQMKMETKSHLTRGQTVKVAQMKIEARFHLTRATLMVRVTQMGIEHLLRQKRQS